MLGESQGKSSRMVRLMVAGVLLFVVAACGVVFSQSSVGLKKDMVNRHSTAVNAMDADVDVDMNANTDDHMKAPMQLDNKLSLLDDIAYGHVSSLRMLRVAPFVVRLASGGNGFCTGAIVSADFVITAKHCLLASAPNQIYFETGITKVGVSAYRQVRVGKKFFKNPSADIALVQMSKPFVLGSYVNKVAIGLGRPPVGTIVSAFGWGGTEKLNGPSTELKFATMKIRPNFVCDNSGILPRQMCVGDVTGNVCKGDSGGPLVRRVNGKFWLVGTVQGGANLGCADRSSADRFEVVGSYRGWILRII